jgi:hypothetical protein
MMSTTTVDATEQNSTTLATASASATATSLTALGAMLEHAVTGARDAERHIAKGNLKAVIGALDGLDEFWPMPLPSTARRSRCSAARAER